MRRDHQKVRIGVCGVGSIGFRHARLLSQRTDVELRLCDTTDQHLETAAALPNISLSTRSFDELIDQGLDGLVIATPDSLHVPQAERACRGGIPVLIEKPIARSFTEGERLRKSSAESGTAVLVGYPLRYNSIFLKGKEIVESGAVGTPVSFHVMLGSYNTLVAAKNRFNGNARNTLFVDYSHEWDYINWFLGRVQRVAGVARRAGALERMQDPNVIDGVLDLEGGLSGTVHLDYVQAPGTRAFTIIGDRGTVVIDAVKGRISLQIHNEDFVRQLRFTETFDDMMRRQHEHFFEVIRGTSAPRVTIEDGLNALRVADAMLSACETGGWALVEI